MANRLKILMASAEVAPFAKVGGLADVAASLPPAVKKLGADVRIIMPKYGLISEKKFKLKKIYSNIEVFSKGRNKQINLWQGKLPGSSVKIYFIENKKYFAREQVYWGNNSERFLFFSLAALRVLPVIKFKPDIIHCHDYHTAMIPDLLKTFNADYFKGIKTIFTIHNLNYQGKSEIEVLSTGNLTKDSLKSLSKDARDNDINFMAQGILSAGIVNTVSKTYAKEITTSFYGAHLDSLLAKRKKDLYGIVNGIDVKKFNPACDKNIKQRYFIRSLDKKIKNKLFLQKKLGWPADKDIFLIGIVGRLVWQKGLDLLNENFAGLDCRFVVLGTGKKEYENHLKKLARKYPDKFSVKIMFDIKLAQLIYAASDAFLMPSRFEPCGLGQMIAMRYGSLPIVRATGGLADTVSAKTGFKFKEFSEQALYKTIKQAIQVYKNNPKKWRQMMIAAMQKDFSWNASAKEYLKLYKKIIK